MHSSTPHVAPGGLGFLLIAWSLIAAKCVAVAWAVERWSVPISAGWIIWPTLVFAALATGLWCARGRD